MKNRILKLLISFLFLFAVASPLWAYEIDGRMIERDSSLYDCIDTLYALTGKAKPNTNRPWSEAQARLYLSKIDTSILSPYGAELYREAEEAINSGLRWNYEEGLGVSAGITFNNEFYGHTNTSFDTEEEWVRGWVERKPLFRIWLEASSGSLFYTAADVHYRYGRATTEDTYGILYDDKAQYAGGYVGSYRIDPTNRVPYVKSSDYFSSLLASNFYTNTLNFSFIWPRRAVFSAGGKDWNLSFNRDRLKIGDSHIGSLLVDDHSDYNDYFRLSFFNSMFTYDWILMGINSLVTSSEDTPEEARVYMIHTLDFRIMDKVSLKLSENVMWKYKVFDPGFLNPSFFLHNLNNRSLFNALAYIEINASLFPGFNIYGQYAMDQSRAPNEGESQSDSFGISLGMEYIFERSSSVFESYLEYLYTSPLLYRRDKVDFIKASRYYHMGSDVVENGHIPFFEYIGYRYGGDTSTLKLGVKGRGEKWGKGEVYLQFLEHGEMTIFSSHNSGNNNDDDANLRGSTPYGEKSTRAIIVSGKYEGDLSSLFHYPGVGFSLEVDWIGRSSYTKKTKEYSGFESDTQVSLGITLAL